jgi:dipeptidyl-peptidase-4
MLSQNGYIVVCVDNRGTGGRGEFFKKQTYLQLGNLETNDQIDAAKSIAEWDFVDKKRIGIFGWSYGGYMSSLCLFKGSDVFKVVRFYIHGAIYEGRKRQRGWVQR